MATGLWPALKLGASNGVLMGGYPFARNQYFVGANSPVFGVRVDNLQALFDRLVSGDIAFIGPGSYDEEDLVIDTPNVTIIGAGNRGQIGIAPSAVGGNGLQILADGVTLVNVGCAKESTADFALKVGSQTISPDRFRAYGCKIEGDGIAAHLQGAGDVIMDDCEFCWCGSALILESNDIGFNTQIRIKNSLFHNYVTVGLGQFAAAQQVNDLWLIDNVFARQEDGTVGTDDILLADNGNTGLITGNRFPRATNGTGFITIGTGLIYNPNGTEAGWSTARPA